MATVTQMDTQTITLELTIAEAAVLKRVLGKVGGNPFGPRGHADSVFYALGESPAVRSAVGELSEFWDLSSAATYFREINDNRKAVSA